MPSEQPSASTVATDPAHTPLFSPRRRWKKPSSGPQPRVGGGNQRGPNPSPLGSPSSRSELKRTLRESAETAGLVLDLNAAKALRGSDASARPDGDNGDLERLGAVRVAVDVDHGAAQSLWSDADEVKLLAAAAAFRERTGRPPLRLDAGSLFDSIRDSVSPHFDEAMVYSKLMRFESKFSCGAPGSSITTHERRVHDLSTRVWGALDVVPLPEDDSCDQEANESYGDERRLITERSPMPAPPPCLDAPRSSAFSMDANAAHTPPSSHSSKKRSLSPLLGMGDGHLDPSSSPCGSPSRRLRISTESTVVTLAAAAAAAAAATLWSDVDGGHEDVQSPESTGVAVDLGRGDVQGLQPSDGGCHGVAPNYPKRWSDAEEVTLLAAAAFFRERTGRSPLPIDAGALFDSIRDSVSPRINEANVSYKLTRFRSKFLHSAPEKSATAHDRLLHDLSAKSWGSVNTVAREARDAATKTPVVTEVLEARDAATKMPVVTEVLREYWKMNELAGLSLEKGLSLLWRKNGRLIETRWRKQFDGEMKTQMRWHDLAKEICGLLNDTIKGLGT
ncbi:hypothetical protein SORBI_3004G311200 [Sorghum bicolor]|uniref:Glabrous enhancer-binding protein-like DBD domain-containing protein n=1 Tax=Sorghum bicolor TaxID=4558 RepID=A0A1Z5RPV2_SORBI|nr:hypothetical protein SORBI_3004G311200 [Sorghum bicolor]